MEKVAEEWAEELGIRIEGWLGSGDNGSAYETSDGRAIKITNNNNEFLCALRLEGIENDYVADIYDTKIMPSGEMAILMELLEINEGKLEDMFANLSQEAEAQNSEIHMIDMDELQTPLSDEECDLGDALWFGVQEIIKTGTNPLDVQPSNIGIKANGNYALFDQFDKNDHPEYSLQEYLEDRSFREIKKPKRKNSYK